ncbi:MAG: RIP metalloprotease RseP [Christensenellaceae bacterium]|jgi:RIP metalloprotease rseP|nr:RIP metalloprotease RseP [Christensenellaceae bacterium]MBS6563957.1 RIP metalloprotease RseP [Clostridiales bacterium]PWL95995.1 MAG: RIP metalloprotease RseP [Selenomonadales bacterium]
MSFLYILIAILILGVLIIVHELGHYTVGKLLKFRITEFGIGFGPKLFSWGKKETKYSIRALPLGGFVAFAGEDEDAPDDPRAMNNMPWYKRLLVLFAGAGFNIIFALLTCFIVICMMGKQLPAPVISSVAEDAPVQQQALQRGDIVTAVDGVDVGSYNEFKAQLDKHVAAEQTSVTLTVSRDGQSVQVPAVLYESTDEAGNKVFKLGVTITYNTVPIPVGEAAKETFSTSWELTKEMFRFLGRLFTGNASIQDVSGPISTIGIMSDQISIGVDSAGAQGAFLMILQLCWIIGMNLAIFNLLPIPALDGGRMVFVIIEAIRRKPINRELEAKIHAIGFMLLIGLVIVLEIARAILL